MKREDDKTMKKTKMKKRVAIPILVSLSVIFCLMAAGWAGSDSGTRGVTDFEHIEAEYLKTIDQLDWPEGFILPEKLEGEDVNASFQVGYGDTRASNLWEYAWMEEWLDTYQTQPEQAEKAIEMLETAFDLPYMDKKRCDDATRNYLRENIKKAKAGDPSGFIECIDVNYVD